MRNEKLEMRNEKWWSGASKYRSAAERKSWQCLTVAFSD